MEDEFREARWLQRWGPVETGLHLLLLVLMIAAAGVVLYRELRKE